MKKTHKLVMLPTEKASHIYLINKTNKLGFVTGEHPEDLEQFPQTIKETQNQHLYILSDDEIKEGDWFMNLSDKGNFVDNCIAEGKGERVVWNLKAEINSLRKIVATTDTSLSIKIKDSNPYGNFIFKVLPQLPESFILAYIKAYNEGKPITEVDLKIEEAGKYNVDELRENHLKGLSHSYDKPMKIKTRGDNTVIIHQSKIYSKAEVDEIIWKYKTYIDMLDHPQDASTKNWIKENL